MDSSRFGWCDICACVLIEKSMGTNQHVKIDWYVIKFVDDLVTHQITNQALSWGTYCARTRYIFIYITCLSHSYLSEWIMRKCLKTDSMVLNVMMWYGLFVLIAAKLAVTMNSLWAKMFVVGINVAWKRAWKERGRGLAENPRLHSQSTGQLSYRFDGLLWSIRFDESYSQNSYRFRHPLVHNGTDWACREVEMTAIFVNLNRDGAHVVL